MKDSYRIPISRFHRSNFRWLCEELGRKDRHLAALLNEFGYPPMWTRPNQFSTLVHIILEQQVSLASASAAYKKIQDYTGGLTAGSLLALSDEEMRACYFSRQKTIYARSLAQALCSGEIRLKNLSQMSDDAVRSKLKTLKGIGDWTVDVYLIFALRRTDILPLGDLAMLRSLKEIKNIRDNSDRDSLIRLTRHWRPYRSIGTMMLWHHYLSKRKMSAIT